MDTFIFYGFLALMGLFVIVLIVRTNRLLNVEAKLLLQGQNKVLLKVTPELQMDFSIRSGATVRSVPQEHMALLHWAQDISSNAGQVRSIRFPALTHA